MDKDFLESNGWVWIRLQDVELSSLEFIVPSNETLESLASDALSTSVDHYTDIGVISIRDRKAELSSSRLSPKVFSCIPW